MSAEFNWWLLIVGVVAGAALTWLVVADSSRREREVGERELPAEAAWIAKSSGEPAVDADTAERVLRAHRRYLGFPPPDVLVAPEELEALQQGRRAGSGVGRGRGARTCGPGTASRWRGTRRIWRRSRRQTCRRSVEPRRPDDRRRPIGPRGCRSGPARPGRRAC